QDGSASLFFESDEFKMDCDLMHEMYTEGLIHPDILNLPSDTIRANKEAGDALMGIMTPISDQLDESGNVVVEFMDYWLNDSGPFLMNLPLLNSNAIPATTKHPEAGLKFLDWMYSSQENQDLVLYGIEGVHWEPVGDTEYRRIKDENNKNLYAFDYWMIEYVPLHRFDVDRTTSAEEDATYIGNTREAQTVLSPVIGFNFNSEPVSVEFANMMAEYTTSILPIKLGVIPYEGNFETAYDKMKAAGCEAVIAEYQKQLQAYIASQN
ncbi:MAG: ABC transporter substrate-binding protein, partial [Bacillota bacterium]|nr:ABC transporter substrate-binding protein [Bacillota bacterium]